jgi:hypothetical protein
MLGTEQGGTIFPKEGRAAFVPDVPYWRRQLINNGSWDYDGTHAWLPICDFRRQNDPRLSKCPQFLNGRMTLITARISPSKTRFTGAIHPIDLMRSYGILGTAPGTSGTDKRYIGNSWQGISRTARRYNGYGQAHSTRTRSVSRNLTGEGLTFYPSH